MYSGLGLELWCLTPLSTIFQEHRGGLFYWWRKPEYSEKTADMYGEIYNVNIINYIKKN